MRCSFGGLSGPARNAMKRDPMSGHLFAFINRRKTIIVTDQPDEWIKAQIEAGSFTNDSEYVRDLIRRDQARNAENEAIRAELIKGEQSGEPQPFDAVRLCGSFGPERKLRGWAACVISPRS